MPAERHFPRNLLVRLERIANSRNRILDHNKGLRLSGFGKQSKRPDGNLFPKAALAVSIECRLRLPGDAISIRQSLRGFRDGHGAKGRVGYDLPSAQALETK